jgi:putative component of membrane protein insertase Oxa1/YidC/SpoIIIJ protein YidD
MFGGGGCKFYPQEKSCSEYAVDVIEEYGIIRGGLLSVKRILSCNNWSTN